MQQRHAEVGRVQHKHAHLAGLGAVERVAANFLRVHRVIDESVDGAGHGVLADHQHAGRGAVESVELPRCAGDQAADAGARVEADPGKSLLPVAPVQVPYDDLGRSRVETTRDGGIRVGGELLQPIGVGGVGIVEGVALLPVIHPGETFHVGEEAEFHAGGISNRARAVAT